MFNYDWSTTKNISPLYVEQDPYQLGVRAGYSVPAVL